MARTERPRKARPVIGWREWVAFPALGIDRIKAKIDTGARSAALHAWNIDVERRGDLDIARFRVQPVQRKRRPVVQVEAPLVDERYVRDSGGRRELRPVVIAEVALGGLVWPIELTLTNRDVMGFRLLLGRRAVRRRFLVDPGRSFLLSE